MADLSTITDYIINEANVLAEKIRKNADEQYETLMNQAAIDAQDEYNKIVNNAQSEAAKIIAMAQSKGAQNEAQNILKFKIQSVDEIIANAKQRIYDMSDEAYNLFIEKLLVKYAEEFNPKGGIVSKTLDKLNPENKGYIVFNKKDKERVKLNSDIIKKYNLAVSDETVDIDGGFIIKYGKVEENCSVSAIFRDRNEYLTDYISAKLFA